MRGIGIAGLENYGLVRNAYIETKELLRDVAKNHDQIRDKYSLFRDNSFSLDLVCEECGLDKNDFLRRVRSGLFYHFDVISHGDFYRLFPVEFNEGVYVFDVAKELRGRDKTQGEWGVNLALAKLDFEIPSMKEYYAIIKNMYDYGLNAPQDSKITELFGKIQQDFFGDKLVIMADILKVFDRKGTFLPSIKKPHTWDGEFIRFGGGLAPELILELFKTENVELFDEVFGWLLGDTLDVSHKRKPVVMGEVYNINGLDNNVVAVGGSKVSEADALGSLQAIISFLPMDKKGLLRPIRVKNISRERIRLDFENEEDRHKWTREL